MAEAKKDVAVDPATPLKSVQQESFAQLVASGRSQADAYRAAFPKSQKWKPDSLHNEASRLAADPVVSPRVKFLRAIILQQAIDDAVADKTWVLKRLKAVAERCLQAAPVLDRKGIPVMISSPDGPALAFTFDPAGANRALELIGKEGGMFIDRKEQGRPGEFGEAGDVAAQKQRITAKIVKLGIVKAQRKSA